MAHAPAPDSIYIPSESPAPSWKGFSPPGVPGEDARITADVLLEADLRGIDSHGIGRLSIFVVGRLRLGSQNPKAPRRSYPKHPHRPSGRGAGMGQVIAVRAYGSCHQEGKRNGHRRGRRAKLQPLRLRPLLPCGGRQGHDRHGLHQRLGLLSAPPSAPSPCWGPTPSPSLPPRTWTFPSFSMPPRPSSSGDSGTARQAPRPASGESRHRASGESFPTLPVSFRACSGTRRPFCPLGGRGEEGRPQGIRPCHPGGNPLRRPPERPVPQARHRRGDGALLPRHRYLKIPPGGDLPENHGGHPQGPAELQKEPGGTGSSSRGKRSI